MKCPSDVGPVDSGDRLLLWSRPMGSRAHPLIALFCSLLLVSQHLWAAGLALAAEAQQVTESTSSSSAGVVGQVNVSFPVASPTADTTQSELASESLSPLEEPIDPTKYLCGAGDMFLLNFWGRQDSSSRIIIDSQGRAFLPKIGYVTVAGLTLAAATAAMRSRIVRLYPRVNFDLSLARPRTFLVHVVGAVDKPGIYSARATDRLTKVLAAAGGRFDGDPSHGRGSWRRIEIARRDGSRLKADLFAYTTKGDIASNPYLNDGDVITVPFEELAVGISGAVQRPGRYELVGAKDLAELVDAAGGMLTEVTTQLPVIVTRRDPATDRLGQIRMNLKEGRTVPDLPLQRGDQVHIPLASELQRSVMIVGAIAGAVQSDEATHLRRFPYENGDTVRSLIERAGGLTAGADYRNSYIVRTRDGLESIVPLDLEALLIYRDMNADRAVEIGDIVNIPFQRHAIIVEGAAMHPGMYQFNPRLTALNYVALAGGPSKMAQSESNYRIVSPQGKTRTVEEDTIPQPGDTIVVPERHFSRAEVTQIIISTIMLGIMTASVIVASQK